ncbi:MAG: hypothetical protein Q4G69_14455, partial [Planctomycetia bacterium]|nr:hypothetical protein [Planctomycetia bacterium]
VKISKRANPPLNPQEKERNIPISPLKGTGFYHVPLFFSFFPNFSVKKRTLNCFMINGEVL